MTDTFGPARRGLALQIVASARDHVEHRAHTPSLWPSDVVDRVVWALAASWAASRGRPVTEALRAVENYIQEEAGRDRA